MNTTTLTDNGAIAYNTTNNALIDLFGQIGAMRTRSQNDIERLISASFNDFPLETLKLIFHLRNIRGGLGERKVGRIALQFIANNYPETMIKNFDALSLFGRWDDFFVFFNTPIEKDMVRYILTQFISDIKNFNKGNFKQVSLLAKWMPSENANAKATKKLARKFIEAFRLTPKQYRIALSNLRNHLRIVENNLRERSYHKINYESVPARAMMKYRAAFNKNDTDAFHSFLEDVKNGKKVIKAGDNIFPSDLVKKCLGYNIVGAEVLDAQWKALPNYIENSDANAICVADVSGSMTCNDSWPLASSIALSLYCAERLNGPYKDHFITFSSRPELVRIHGNTLKDKIKFMNKSNWEMNTDVEAVFDLILDVALKNKLTQKQVPNRVIIISDMQFDQARNNHYSWVYRGTKPIMETNSLFKTIKMKYLNYGYQLPQLVFWNVNATNEIFPMTKDDNVQFVSGYSPRIFEAVLKDEFLSPFDLVLDVVNKPMYSIIKL